MKITFFAIALAFFANLCAMEQQNDQAHHQIVQQHINIQLNVENQAPALQDYKLEVEIRRVNDPIFKESYPLDLGAAESKSMQLNIDFAELQNIAASNLIARLVKDNDVAEDHYVHSFNVNGIAGLKVVVKPKNPENLAQGNTVTIFPTVDAAGNNPVNN